MPLSTSSRAQTWSLTTRTIGVFKAPKTTFESVIREPAWAGALLLVFVVSAGAGLLLLSTDVGRLAFLDQWTNTAEAFGRPVDQQLYGEIESLSERAPLVALATAAANGPLLIVGVSLLLHMVFSIWLRAGRPYVMALAITAHAAMILAARQAVAAPIRYARESLASPTTLGMLFPMFDEGSLAARFLWIIDVFVIWWLVVLALGTSMLYSRPAGTLAMTYVAVYIGGALALAGIMVLFGGTA